MVIWNHFLLQTCMTSDTPKGHTICGMQNSRNPHMLIGVSWDPRSSFHITSPEFLGCSGWWGCHSSVNVKPRGFKVSPGSHRSTPTVPFSCHLPHHAPVRSHQLGPSASRGMWDVVSTLSAHSSTFPQPSLLASLPGSYWNFFKFI